MTSGIRDVGGPQPWQAQLESIAKDPLLFTPGTETSYSNTNYDLLGELIEQWTGEKYGTFIQDQILEPLGMSETQELGRSATVPNQAVGYNAPRHGRWPKADGAERTGDVRRRRDGLDGPGHGHLYDGTPERPSPRSRDLRVDVDLDTDAAIRGEAPLRRRARPGMGYGDRHERRARRGRQGRAGPRIHLRAHPLPPLGQRSLRLLQHQLSTAVGIRAASPPCRWPSRCTRRPRPGPLRGGDSDAGGGVIMPAVRRYETSAHRPSAALRAIASQSRTSRSPSAKVGNSGAGRLPGPATIQP